MRSPKLNSPGYAKEAWGLLSASQASDLESTRRGSERRFDVLLLLCAPASSERDIRPTRSTATQMVKNIEDQIV